jgi:hypothetical protein
VRSCPAVDMRMPGGIAEEAERLIASAERDGGIKLADLSQAELCALRAETTSLVCERTCQWWVRLGRARRERLGRTALDLMAARRLLRLPPGASAADLYESGQLTNEQLAPELAIILAARTSPRPLVACRVPGQDDLNWCHPRFFGITSPGRSLRALLCEVLTGKPAGLHRQPTLGTILRYTLMTPDRTARMITSWAQLFPDGQQRGGQPAVTLLAHRERQMLDQERLQIRSRDSALTLTRTGPDGRPDLAFTLDETGTIMELTSALHRMAQ